MTSPTPLIDDLAITFCCAGDIPLRKLTPPERRVAVDRMRTRGLSLCAIAIQCHSTESMVRTAARTDDPEVATDVA